jgi:hypothetical protein
MHDFNFLDLKGSKLCLSCGMCCQGILFYQTLDPQPFAISPEPRNPILPLACRLFSFSRNNCLIYHDTRHPLDCCNYRCQLLKELLKNDMTLDQAQLKIKNIKNLLDKILVQISHTDPPIPVYLRIQGVFNTLQRELDSGNRSHLELFLDIIWLRFLLSRHLAPVSTQEHYRTLKKSQT